ncbi:lymphocyte antigen 6 complex locus protein G5b [Ornithorhynchus anatinus]|uniref:lymphocyte antigen 6 complex locus protein G5b n=1 Tax=Ornithorhynchus anatinus TaxID=9258 RepID=UPI0010A7FECE|nr:lymphocyte antigen 6 complex locus protein G5b [Ornithorhynchus anatinus]
MKARILMGLCTLLCWPGAPALRCKHCLLEVPNQGCLDGSNFCNAEMGRACMTISIHRENELQYLVRGCGRQSGFHCGEIRVLKVTGYWYRAQCCRHDYCNSWTSAQLQAPDAPRPKGTKPPTPTHTSSWLAAH